MSQVAVGSFDRPVYAEPGVRRVWHDIRWDAVLCGAVAAVGVQLLMTVLGIAIGVTAMDAADTVRNVDGSARDSISIAAAAWWLVTGTLSLLLGGLITGRLAGLPKSGEACLHGLTMWAVVAVFGFVVLWSGAGMASNAVAYPLAYSAQSTTSSLGLTGPGSPLATPADRAPGAAGSPDAPRITLEDAERARRAARTASWWSVVGLLAGIGASVAGAYLQSGPYVDRRVTTTSP
jgi:hypothetical protein